MSKISLTLEVSAFDKSRIEERTFDTKDGKKTVKEYKVDVIPLKEKKFVSKGADWQLFKTHFVVQSQTKEERAVKADPVYVGNGYQFESDDEVETKEDKLRAQAVVENGGFRQSDDDIPF